MQKIIDGVLVESVQKEWGCYGCEFMNRRGIEVCSDCLTGKIPRLHIWKRVEEKPVPEKMRKIIDGILVESAPIESTAYSCKGCYFASNDGCISKEFSCLSVAYSPVIWKRVEEKPAPSHLTNRHFIDNLWRWKCGLPEEEEKSFEPIDIYKLAKEQMSSRFIDLMTNRMILGTLRYGRWQDNKKNGTKYDRVGSIRKRLQLFEETGNSEYLVDIANFAMIEFEISDHPNLHFSPKDDDGEHVQKL